MIYELPARLDYEITPSGQPAISFEILDEILDGPRFPGRVVILLPLSLQSLNIILGKRHRNPEIKYPGHADSRRQVPFDFPGLSLSEQSFLTVCIPIFSASS